LEYTKFRQLAHAILRPQVLADLISNGVDEVEFVRLMLARQDIADVWDEASASESEVSSLLIDVLTVAGMLMHVTARQKGSSCSLL
jgi:hypothetical protein